MKKKIILITIIIINLIIISFGGIKLYNYIRVKNAKIEVKLKEDLTLEFNSNKKVSDFIENINGKILDDYEIDSTKLGKKNITFRFINDENIKLTYTYSINIIDTVKPVIWLGNSYSLPVGSDVDIAENVLCGDNEDNNPNCYIEGEYDVKTPGTYPLEFIAKDRSGNENIQKFTLTVYEPSESNSSSNQEKIVTKFEDVVGKYKTDQTKIGIDISEWQGDVDFKKLKDAGVEFVIIRVGGTKGKDGEYFLDSKFKQNIENANKYDIDAGIYFYSYANSSKKAKENAKWVLKQIKGYDVKLPIAFDWEEWSNFNKYNLSFFNLTSMAEDYINVITNAGYKGMLYSSKSYLESIWLKTNSEIWLAHYTDETNYEGDYKYWQLCNNGQVDGINGDVDIDIMYEK